MKIVTMKVWEQTLANLKLLAAIRRKTMLSVLDELVTAALEEEDKKHLDHLRTGLKDR